MDYFSEKATDSSLATWLSQKFRDASKRLVILLDGGAGSGKTTLAKSLVNHWERPLELVSLDDLYPGWEGLAAGTASVLELIQNTKNPGYYCWDWQANQAGNWVAIAPEKDLLIEGCGTITPATAALASFSIWCDAPLEIRKKQALSRQNQGDFAEYWDIWQRQEEQHWRENQPQIWADLRLEYQESPNKNNISSA